MLVRNHPIERFFPANPVEDESTSLVLAKLHVFGRYYLIFSATGETRHHEERGEHTSDSRKFRFHWSAVEELGRDDTLVFHDRATEKLLCPFADLLGDLEDVVGGQGHDLGRFARGHLIDAHSEPIPMTVKDGGAR